MLSATNIGTAVLFLLNVAKCISYCPLDHTPLIYRLFRDGSLYFMMSVTLFHAPIYKSVLSDDRFSITSQFSFRLQMLVHPNKRCKSS